MKTHVAIMRKSWGLIPKILSGEKIIESRWYKNQYRPWKEIEPEDIVYFKNSGEPVSLRARVDNVLRFDKLTPEKVAYLLKKYGKDDGIELEKEFDKYFEMFKDKKYCLLIFLKKVEKILPFDMNKKGFGAMSSWLTINNIDQIKI